MNTDIEKLPTHYDRLYIGGKWVNPISDTHLNIVSPHDQTVIGSVALASEKDIDAAVEAAKRALNSSPWSAMTAKGPSGYNRPFYRHP